MPHINLRMGKQFTRCLIFLLFPLQLIAQDITGVWKGTISTTDKQLPYELAITSNDGKLTGYSYTTFDVNGTEMVAVKAVQVRNDNGIVTISDDGLVFNNFKDDAPKDIKQTDNLSLLQEGDVLTMKGKFTTKGTRKFRPLTGDISLQKQKDTALSRLIPKLDSLNLASNLSFLRPKLAAPTVTVADVVKLKTDSARSLAVNTTPPALQGNAALKKLVPEPEPVIVKATPLKTVPVAVVPAPVKKIVPAAPPREIAKAVVPPKPVAKAIVPVPPAKPVLVQAAVSNTIAVKAAAQNNNAPIFTAELAKRSIENIETIYFKTDSLQLTLYDNGEVDGDTVSVILNGRMFMPRQGLSTNAITKTIYITPDMGDSLQIVMYAENLGTLPPNTGLLIVYDGKDRYEVRFSGDLTKNAAITLRRRKL